MTIGITETYDPCYDFTWINNKKDLNILITKTLSKKLINILTNQSSDWHYNKCNSIIHLTCTGWGGTELEPKVLDPQSYLNNVIELINLGYPISRLVLRIDPIIPTLLGIRKFISVLRLFKSTGINRVRISVMDLYGHVKDRLSNSINPDINSIIDSYYYQDTLKFHANKEWFDIINKILINTEFNNYRFESCAEKFLNCIKLGCVSNLDLLINNIYLDELNYSKTAPRINCLCLNKSQLIKGGYKGRCPNKCMYCYIKD